MLLLCYILLIYSCCSLDCMINLDEAKDGAPSLATIKKQYPQEYSANNQVYFYDRAIKDIKYFHQKDALTNLFLKLNSHMLFFQYVLDEQPDLLNPIKNSSELANLLNYIYSSIYISENTHKKLMYDFKLLIYEITLPHSSIIEQTCNRNLAKLKKDISKLHIYKLNSNMQLIFGSGYLSLGACSGTVTFINQMGNNLNPILYSIYVPAVIIPAIFISYHYKDNKTFKNIINKITKLQENRSTSLLNDENV